MVDTSKILPNAKTIIIDDPVEAVKDASKYITDLPVSGLGTERGIAVDTKETKADTIRKELYRKAATPDITPTGENVEKDEGVRPYTKKRLEELEKEDKKKAGSFLVEDPVLGVGVNPDSLVGKAAAKAVDNFTKFMGYRPLLKKHHNLDADGFTTADDIVFTNEKEREETKLPSVVMEEQIKALGLGEGSDVVRESPIANRLFEPSIEEPVEVDPSSLTRANIKRIANLQKEAEAKEPYRINQNLFRIKEKGEDGFPVFIYKTRTGFDLKLTSRTEEEVRKNVLEIDNFLKRSGAEQLSEINPMRTSFTREVFQAELDPMRLISAAQKNLQREYNNNVNNMNLITEKYGIDLKSDVKNLLAAAITITQAPETTLAPIAKFGYAPSIANVLDTIAFPLNGLFTQILVDAGNMNQNDEIIRSRLAGEDDYIINVNPTYNTLGLPTKAKINPNVAVLKLEEVQNMFKNRKDPNVAVGIIRDFVVGNAVVLGLSYPFKKGAMIAAKKIHDVAVKRLDAKAAAGKLPINYGHATIRREMDFIFKQEQKKMKESFFGAVGRWVKKTKETQQYEYAIAPKLWLQDVKNQELWFATGANALTYSIDKLFSRPAGEAGALENMFTEMGGGIIGLTTAGAAGADLRNIVIRGVRYPIAGSLFLGTKLLGALGTDEFKAGTYKTMLKLFDPKISPDSYKNDIEYKNLTKEQQKVFDKLAKKIIKRRGDLEGDGRQFAEQMDGNYRYMVALKEQFDEANKALPEGQKFSDEEIAFSMGTMFQSSYIRRMEMHIIAQAEKRAAKGNKKDALEILEAMDVLSREKEKLDDIQQNILGRLNLVPEGEAFDVLNNFKKSFQESIDKDISDQEVRQYLIDRAQQFYLQEALDGHKFSTESSEFILDLIKKNDLIDEPDRNLIVTMGGLRSAAIDLEQTARITAIGAMNDNRKFLRDLTESSDSKIETYNTKGLNKDGSTDNKSVVINTLKDKANRIKTHVQKSGRITINNVMSWSTKRYSRLYDETFNKLGADKKVDFTDEVFEVIRITSEGGPLSQLPKVRSIFGKLTREEVVLQFRNNADILVATINKTQSKAEQITRKDLMDEVVERIKSEQQISTIDQITIFDHAAMLKKIAEERNVSDTIKFNIKLDYRALKEIQSVINSTYDKAASSGNFKLPGVKNVINKAIDKHHNKIIQKYGKEGEQLVKELEEVNGIYRDWVLIKKEKSILHKLAEELQVENPSGVYKGKKGKALEDRLLKQTKGSIPTPEFDLEQGLKNPNKDFFDELFSRHTADDIWESIKVTFGTPTRKVNAKTKVATTTYSAPVKNARKNNGDIENPFYHSYESFMKQLDVYIASRTAESLDKAKVEGSMNIDNIISLNFTKEEDIDTLLKGGFNFETSPGLVGAEDNLKFFDKVRRLNNVSGGTMANVQRKHYDILNDWAGASQDKKAFLNNTLKEGAKVIKTEVLGMKQASVKFKRILESLNNTKSGIMNLKDSEAVLDLVVSDPDALARAKKYALASGMKEDVYNKGMISLVAKGLIKKHSKVRADGKIMYGNKPMDKTALQAENLDATPTELKTNKNVQVISVPNKAISGVELDDYIEQNYKNLKQVFGENSIVLKHLQLLARISKAVSKRGGDDMIALGGDGTLEISLQGLQSRLWAIASNRASYHYVAAEAMLSFLKNRDADSLLAFATADKDFTGAFMKAIMSGDTSLFGTRKLQAPEYFVARAITLSPTIKMAFFETEEQRSKGLDFNGALTQFVRTNPDRDPYRIFPNIAPVNSQLGRKYRNAAGNPTGYSGNVDLASHTQRSKYIKDLVSTFITLRNNPVEEETINELFERAYQDLRNVKIREKTLTGSKGYQLPE